MQTLSAFLRRDADLAHDGKIPADTLGFIRTVESAERAMQRSLGPVESAFQTVVFAWEDVRDRHAELRALKTAGAAGRLNPGQARDLIAAAHHELRQANEWFEDVLARYRAALHDEAGRSAA